MGGQLTHPEVDLSGKVAIVTGANTGIGYETAKAIACMGAHTILACRTEQRAQEAIDRLKQEAEGKTVNVEFMKLNLASLQSTKEFIENFKQKNLPLHLLICNAGVLPGTLQKTEDDLALWFQTNHLGHMFICLELLPCLLNTEGDRRIIVVSSLAHSSGRWDPNNLQGEVRFGTTECYNDSKLHNVMMAYSLHRRIRGNGITVTTVHPGLINTEIARNTSGMLKIASFVVKPFFKNTQQGAITQINCAVNPDLRSDEMHYFKSCATPSLPSVTSRNEQYQEELWRISFDLLKDWLSPETKEKYGPAPSADTKTEDGENADETVADQAPDQ